MIGFAHRGAPDSEHDQNTLGAFERALRLGAQGLETDIGLTVDGIPVLVHAGISIRRVPVSKLRRDQLPAQVPALADLYERCGGDFDLSLDMAEPRAVDAVIHTATQYGALDRLWLTYWRLHTLEAWRSQWPTLHLVYPTVPLSPGTAGRLIPRLARMRIDAVNVFHAFCSRRTVELAHTHHIMAFAWGIRALRQLRRAERLGVDGVFCDDVVSMVALSAGTDAL